MDQADYSRYLHGRSCLDLRYCRRVRYLSSARHLSAPVFDVGACVFHAHMKSRWLAAWPPQYGRNGIFERY